MVVSTTNQRSASRGNRGCSSPNKEKAPFVRAPSVPSAGLPGGPSRLFGGLVTIGRTRVDANHEVRAPYGQWPRCRLRHSLVLEGTGCSVTGTGGSRPSVFGGGRAR